MSLHFHRSLAFWLGLPGFLFLFWGWQDSNTMATWLECGPINVLSGGNLIVLKTARDWQFDYGRVLLKEVERTWLFEESGFHQKTGLYYDLLLDDHWVGIPYWLAILLYSIGWARVIRWRERRRQKMLESIFGEHSS